MLKLEYFLIFNLHNVFYTVLNEAIVMYGLAAKKFFYNYSHLPPIFPLYIHLIGSYLNVIICLICKGKLIFYIIYEISDISVTN